MTAVALKVTATGATSNGYITVYPDGSTRPLTSNLGFSAGQTLANTVIVQVSADRYVELANVNAGTTHLVADLEGCYLPGGVSSHHSVAQTRLLDTRKTKSPIPGWRQRAAELRCRISRHQRGDAQPHRRERHRRRLPDRISGRRERADGLDPQLPGRPDARQRGRGAGRRRRLRRHRKRRRGRGEPGRGHPRVLHCQLGREVRPDHPDPPPRRPHRAGRGVRRLRHDQGTKTRIPNRPGRRRVIGGRRHPRPRSHRQVSDDGHRRERHDHPADSRRLYHHVSRRTSGLPPLPC